MSANTKQVQTALELCSEMLTLVRGYERGKASVTPDMEVDLSAGQIATLKSQFATKRNAAKAALDAVTAE
jgi:hypothetical protein